MQGRVLGFSVALMAFAPPAAAVAKKAKTVVCGQTLTKSVKLANDLYCPTSDGLVVGADNITIDLNRHVLGADPGETRGAGINVGGHRRVRIRNGRIHHFGEGVLVQRSSNVRVDRMEVDSDLGSDIAVRESNDVRITRVRTGNGDSHSVSIDRSRDVLVADSSAGMGNGGAGFSVAESDAVTLRDNVASGAGNDGFIIWSGSRIRLTRNSSSHNRWQYGFEIMTPGVTMKSNVAHDNNGLGISAVPGIKDGGGNRAWNNNRAYRNDVECFGVFCAP